MWYVYADPGGIGRIGVRSVPGGAVFDTFEHNGADEVELLVLAEERNSPIRVETFDHERWQPRPEKYPANTANDPTQICGLFRWIMINHRDGYRGSRVRISWCRIGGQAAQ